MESNLRELIDILTREQVVFQEYLGLIRDQQKHLIQNDLDAVKDSTDRINALAKEAANLENSRRDILSSISIKIDTEPVRLDVSRLLAIFDNPRFKELEHFKDTMLEIHNRIGEQNTRNELLIEQSIRMISQTMLFINEVNSPDTIYENSSITVEGANGNAELISRMI
jgi:flagellar biosynthesis/type III secretory pathway chaperone